jgi:cytochrome c oxidase cbb3-type subunit I/II
MSSDLTAADAARGMGTDGDQVTYDDAIVRKFAMATYVWGIVAFLVGVLVALQMVAPIAVERFGWLGWMRILYETEWINFGRLRPLHTNAAIFAFAGNAIFTAVYYSTQRLCKVRMWSDLLSNLHFWGWQAIIVSAAVTLPLGFTQGKEYAELEWPIDIAIAIVWAGFFGVNFMMTLVRRRERHLYVALWFYIASISVVAVLHVFNSLSVVAGPMKSYPVYAGTQDALMQWWYGHNAVAFVLTTPFLGLMYYFLPKAANRPVFSYKLSIVHFWSLVFVYIWAGPHHLHYTALPVWASTLGMLFSVMLWMPSWGGMINGLMTLRGAWNKVVSDPVLKFFVVGVTFYGMSTFEGPLLSVKSVNSLSHYTDWTIGHVHGGTLGWVGFMTFGMLYWLLPRLYQNRLWSNPLAEWHFWLGTIGIFGYWLSMQWAGITQGLMWRAFDDTGSLAYPEFVETVTKLMPMYWIRAASGALYMVGALLMGLNWFMTWRGRARPIEPVTVTSPPLSPGYEEPPPPESRLVGGPVRFLDRMTKLDWHRRWESRPLRFTAFVILAIAVGSLVEAAPLFAVRTNIPTISTVTPYTPLELYGRDIYIAEGCYNCHSQMIRPIFAETQRYGEYSKPGEFVYDHPFQWGSRRIGPDLARAGITRSGAYDWHVQHFNNPRALIEGSIMPAYPHLGRRKVDYADIPVRMRQLTIVGVPYTPGEIDRAEDDARAQARRINEQLVEQGAGIHGPDQYADTEMIALIAYLDRLGTDLNKTPEADAAGGEE